MRMLLVLPVIGMISLSFSSAGEEKNALKKMQGTWNMISNESSGKKLTKEMIEKNPVELVVKKNTYKVLFSEKLIDQGKLKLNGAKSPSWVDAASSKADVKMKGIYKYEKKKMHVVFAPPGAPRPTAFSTTAKNMHIYIIYERKK